MNEKRVIPPLMFGMVSFENKKLRRFWNDKKLTPLKIRTKNTRTTMDSTDNNDDVCLPVDWSMERCYLFTDKYVLLLNVFFMCVRVGVVARYAVLFYQIVHTNEGDI